MITIRTYDGGQYFDVPNDLTLSLESNSPFFSEDGSYSLPVTLPPTPKNLSMVDYCHRVDGDLTLADIDVVVQNGIYSFRGTMKILSYSASEGVECSILSNQSSISSALGDMTLADLWEDAVLCSASTTNIAGLIDQIKVMTKPDTDGTDENNPLHKISCFPVATSTCILNQQRAVDPSYPTWPDFLLIARDTTITHQEEDYQISYPTGCWCSPFLRLWYIIDRIAYKLKLDFDDEDNVFRTGKYKYLCLLNNSIDPCLALSSDRSLYVVKYRHLVPDIKVTDFLTELFNQFGIVLFTDGGALKTYQVNDVLNSECEVDFDKYISGVDAVSYTEPQALEITQSAEPLVLDESAVKADSLQAFKKNTDGSAASIILRDYSHFYSQMYQHNHCEYHPERDEFQDAKMQRYVGFFDWIPEDLQDSHMSIQQSSVPYQAVYAEAVPSRTEVSMPYIGEGLNKVLNITVNKSDGSFVDCTLNTACPLCFAYDNVGFNYDNLQSKLRYGSRVLYKDGYEGVRGSYSDGDVFSSDVSLSPHNSLADMSAYDAALRSGMHKISASLIMTASEVLSLSFFKPVVIHGRKCILKSYRTEVSDDDIQILDAVFLTI